MAKLTTFIEPEYSPITSALEIAVEYNPDTDEVLDITGVNAVSIEDKKPKDVVDITEVMTEIFPGSLGKLVLKIDWRTIYNNLQKREPAPRPDIIGTC